MLSLFRIKDILIKGKIICKNENFLNIYLEFEVKYILFYKKYLDSNFRCTYLVGTRFDRILIGHTCIKNNLA